MKSELGEQLFQFAVAMNKNLAEVIRMTEPKKTYRIPCNWTMYGVMEVEATSLDEAIEKAYDSGLPEGDYLTDSFDVDQTAIPMYNETEGV